MEEQTKEDKIQSGRNMTNDYFKRLNLYFYKSNEASAILDSYNWFQSLIILYREIFTKLKKQEQEEWDNKICNLNAKVFQNIQLCYNINKWVIPQDLYMELHKFDVFIKKVMERSGMLEQMRKISQEEIELRGV